MGGWFKELDDLFHPRAMAMVGVSTGIESMGMSFLLGYRRLGFSGELYAIHPRKQIKDFPTYPSLESVPGPVDYVIVAVPALAVPEVMKDCAAKGVRCVTIFSSGFRESGTEEGRALEEEVVRIAREGGLRVIGPNCMGIHCPASGMSIRADMPKTPPGRIGLLSQSGGISISITLMAAERGVGFSKVISYGNECDLGAPEFLRYLAEDPETAVICLYIEGSRRPEEFRSALSSAAAKKPVIILKGGTTEVGNRAVASHTGALAGSLQVWEALAKQSGAVLVHDTDEMLDLALLFALSRRPGKRLGLFTISGGFGVFATDQVVQAGFEMPLLDHTTQQELGAFVNAPGTSLKNPVDMAAKFFQPHNYQKILTIFDRDPGLDAFLMIGAMEYLTYLDKHAADWSAFMVKALINAMKEMKKPVYVVLLHTAEENLRLIHERSFLAAGLPVFPTMSRCLLALSRARSMRKPTSEADLAS